jgi:hypothetical protein
MPQSGASLGVAWGALFMWSYNGGQRSTDHGLDRYPATMPLCQPRSAVQVGHPRVQLRGRHPKHFNGLSIYIYGRGIQNKNKTKNTISHSLPTPPASRGGGGSQAKRARMFLYETADRPTRLSLLIPVPPLGFLRSWAFLFWGKGLLRKSDNTTEAPGLIQIQTKSVRESRPCCCYCYKKTDKKQEVRSEKPKTGGGSGLADGDGGRGAPRKKK